MERERPEYLPPIKPRRWSFPWLTLIGLTVLILAAFGVKQHLDTQSAWNTRFATKPTVKPAARDVTTNLDELRATAQREAKLAEIRLRRVAAEREAINKEREEWRCIDGTPFRKIPGGWENVPGERC
ncbi:hypothetical protein [Stenotrophomonas sp. ATCM1_4]|uniref:hypothetical protein n=1 Tax=Stenotrophomonas sp. ATCM1_4 TaxID=2259330 RepID=UPI0010538459|nr:hypothetical protein [Stenotrophomonas sp. ATCM1_4]